MSPMSPRLLRPKAAEARELYVAAAYSGLGRLNGFVFISNDGANFIAIGPDNGTFVPETGINDPTIMRWQGRFYMCYGDGPPGWDGVGPRVHVAVSDDMVSWSPVVTLVLGEVAPSPGVNIPNWVIDPQGPAIMVGDYPHQVLCVRPASPSPSTWGNSANWQEPVAIKDANNETLIQGNTYIVYKAGTYYMAFNDVSWNGYKTRTSQSLTTGWSAATTITLGDSEASNGDTQPLVLRADGGFRLYATNGNNHTYELWYYESNDFVTWSASTPLSFIGMGTGFAINWAHISRLMVPPSLAARLFNEYTPPPPPPPPPAETVLLMHFNTDLSDSSANDLTATAYEDAVVSGDEAKWGAGSLLLDGDGDYVDVESSGAFAFSSFTVEAWIYAVSWPQYCWLVDFRDGGAFTMGFSSGKFYPYVGNVDQAQSSGSALPTGEWVHVAFCYDGTSVKCYANGTLAYTLNDSGATQSSNAPKIGSNSSGSGEFFNGYIDDLRISEGVVYSGNFTAPTGPLSP